MSDSSGDRHYPTLLVATAKSAVAIAFLSVLATHWLSNGTLDHNELSRLAFHATRTPEGPMTTGSLAKAVTATKLDPCVTPRP